MGVWVDGPGCWLGVISGVRVAWAVWTQEHKGGVGGIKKKKNQVGCKNVVFNRYKDDAGGIRAVLAVSG